MLKKMTRIIVGRKRDAFMRNFLFPKDSIGILLNNKKDWLKTLTFDVIKICQSNDLIHHILESDIWKMISSKKND